MIYKCTSCQHETPAALPPKPAKPDACEKCGGPVTGLHDTEPPPPVEEDGDALPNDDEESDEASGAASKGAKPKLLISTMLYSLAHELGAEAATAELHRQVAELSGPFVGERPHDEFLPVAYLIARATRVFDVGLFVDAGATQISKARCRAMAHALKHPEFDVWISVDDDVEATLSTLVGLYDAVADGQPSIAIAPCFLRGRPLVNVAFPQIVSERTLTGTMAKMRPALYGGFGLVAMSQAALQHVAEVCDWFVDDDGEHKPAAFAEFMVDDRKALKRNDRLKKVWFGEDLSFFLRVPKTVRVEALLTGHTRHAGETLNLARLEEYETFRATDAWLEAKDAPPPAPELEPEPAPELEAPSTPREGRRLSASQVEELEPASVVDGPA